MDIKYWSLGPIDDGFAHMLTFCPGDFFVYAKRTVVNHRIDPTNLI
jgi:hypothetical protein